MERGMMTASFLKPTRADGFAFRQLVSSLFQVEFILDDSDRHKPKAKDVKYVTSGLGGHPHC